MKTEIQLRHIEDNAHSSKRLKEFVEDTVVHTLGKFEKGSGMQSLVIVDQARGRSAFHEPVFNCELVLQIAGERRPFVVSKESPDIHTAVRQCVSAAEKCLRRASKIRVSERRHQLAA